MKADDQTFFDFVRVLRKRARPAAIAAFAVLIAMTSLVFLLPTIYESRATMMIEQLDAQIDLAGGQGTREYVEQRLQRTRQLAGMNDLLIKPYTPETLFAVLAGWLAKK